MPHVYNDEEFDDDDSAGGSDASRRLATATQNVNLALGDALEATQRASRLLPRLLIVAAIAAGVAAVAIVYGVVAYLLHAPAPAP